jgi:hypothetical protein
MNGFPPDDNLMSWIAELRTRLDRDHGIRALPDAHAIQIMLADLDGFEDMDPDEVGAPVNVARRASLLADFRALQLLID